MTFNINITNIFCKVCIFGVASISNKADKYSKTYNNLNHIINLNCNIKKNYINKYTKFKQDYNILKI